MSLKPHNSLKQHIILVKAIKILVIVIYFPVSYVMWVSDCPHCNNEDPHTAEVTAGGDQMHCFKCILMLLFLL